MNVSPLLSRLDVNCFYLNTFYFILTILNFIRSPILIFIVIIIIVIIGIFIVIIGIIAILLLLLLLSLVLPLW